jgi:FkbM family methyltransferase
MRRNHKGEGGALARPRMVKLRLDETLIRMRKVAVLASDWFYLRRFLAHGVAPAIEHTAVLQHLPFDFVVDAGANRGQFSLVCRRIRPRAMIVAFEPLPDPASVYRALFADDARVRLYATALGAERGEVAMHVSARDDSSSLLPIAKAQTDNYPGSGKVGTHLVTVAPMPDFIAARDLGAHNLLKIDVQGYELEVLKSAQTLLLRFEWIYVECSYIPLYEGQPLAKEVTDFVTTRGFMLTGRYNVSYVEGSGGPLQADLLFTRAQIAR